MRILPLMIALVLLMSGQVMANPSPEPVHPAHLVGYVVITLASFAMEIIIAVALFRYGAGLELTWVLPTLLLLLNAMTYFGVLHPVYLVTHSVVLAEVSVLAAESAAYFYILKAYASDLANWKRATGYALIANLASLAISVIF